MSKTPLSAVGTLGAIANEAPLQVRWGIILCRRCPLVKGLVFIFAAPLGLCGCSARGGGTGVAGVLVVR
jgi:hypothetical protein